MVCRHARGDPNCSSYQVSSGPTTPDAERFQVNKVAAIAGNLVLEVAYPNCRSCSYEGRKILVYLGVGPEQALLWRRIDPHFRDPQVRRSDGEAPSPAARFPASDEGWSHAIDYASSVSARRR